MKLVGSNSTKLVTWELYEYYSGVYVVKVEDSYERAMLFLRYQEHYESPFEGYYNNNFNILEFMNSYRKFGICTGLSKEQARIFNKQDRKEFIQYFKSYKCRS